MAAIAERFARIVARYPDLTAVKSGRRELTYRQLDTLAGRLARHVAACCPDGGRTVALALDHGVDLCLGALACLKAERVYVPLDRREPPERLGRILADADSALLLSAGELPAGVPGGIDVLDIHDAPPAPPPVSPTQGRRTGDVAFLLYTSGSTGTPKGVMAEHGAVVARVAGHNRFGVGPGDRLTALGSGGMNLYRALLTGAALVALDLRRVPVDALAAWLREEAITVYHSVPTVFRRFVATLDAKLDLPALRVVNLTGETLFGSDVDAFRTYFPERCVLVNGLGTTETGTFRELRIDRGSPLDEGVVPVGGAVEGMEVALLDERGNAVGKGEIGEIVVSGEHLSPGYWRRPDLTAERFVEDRDGSRNIAYRTGDLGRFLPDGSLVHLGRLDFQVKVRGHRVEVAEVEAAMLEHPGVAEAAVVGRREDGDVRLAGFAVPREPNPPEVDALRRFLRERLPEYMVPGVLAFMRELPVLPNGKIDRRALPGDAAPATGPSSLRRAPRDATETQLAVIWSEVLRVPSVAIDDDFFRLGGDSLAAARLMARVLVEFAVELPLGTVFQRTTIAELAQAIAAAAACARSNPLVSPPLQSSLPSDSCAPQGEEK